jgi:hypothetical protein
MADPSKATNGKTRLGLGVAKHAKPGSAAPASVLFYQVDQR